MNVRDAIERVDARTEAFTGEFVGAIGHASEPEAMRAYLLGMSLDDPELLLEATGSVAGALWREAVDVITGSGVRNPVMTIRNSLLQMVLLGYLLGESASSSSQRS